MLSRAGAVDITINVTGHVEATCRDYHGRAAH
jgi:hypothetical protein